MNKNILAIIPARGGSKGLPDKNIRLLGGKPLISYAIKLARQARAKGLISGHIVSTDSPKIASVAKRCRGSVPFLRPSRLATDKSMVIDTIVHAVNWWEKANGARIHSVLLLQPTHPLTPFSDVEKAVKNYLKNQPKAKSLISVCDAQDFRVSTLYYKEGPYLEQVKKDIDPAKRRQDLRDTYWRNGGIYIMRRDMIFKEKKVIDDRPLFYEMSRSDSVDIDDIFGLKFAEFLLKHKKGKI